MTGAPRGSKLGRPPATLPVDGPALVVLVGKHTSIRRAWRALRRSHPSVSWSTFYRRALAVGAKPKALTVVQKDELRTLSRARKQAADLRRRRARQAARRGSKADSARMTR